MYYFIINSLQNPYLLHMEDVRVKDDFISILTQYVEGGSLRDMIHKVTVGIWGKYYNTNSNFIS